MLTDYCRDHLVPVLERAILPLVQTFAPEIAPIGDMTIGGMTSRLVPIAMNRSCVLVLAFLVSSCSAAEGGAANPFSSLLNGIFGVFEAFLAPVLSVANSVVDLKKAVLGLLGGLG